MRKVLVLACLVLGSMEISALAYEEASAVYIIAPEAPPTEKEEVIPVSPGPTYIWIKGHWAWHRGWVWEPGHYATLPHETAIWLPGHWDRRPHGWLWIPGHWA